MRFDGGWIKIHRVMSEHWIGRDLTTLGLFVTLLMWANRDQSKRRIGSRIETIERGQVVTSAVELATRFKSCRKNIIKILNRLEKDGVITQKKDIRGRVITVQNFDKYQQLGRGDATPHATEDATPHATDNGQHTPHLTPHVLEKGRREEGKKERSTFESKPSKAPPSQFDLDLADQWAAFAVGVSKTVKPDRDKWADTVRLLRERNKFAEADLAAMLDHAKADPFWQVNVASLPALRTRSKNGLLKAENLLAAAKDSGRVDAPFDWSLVFGKETEAPK